MSRSARERFAVPSDGVVALDAVDTASTKGAPGDKKETKAATDGLRAELATLQRRLAAEAQQSVLVVLQSRDAGGKDGTVRKVFAGVNPAGVKVTSFKQPTETELAHDFLWRVHPHAPAAGEIAIFNRSHYEDVLVARVHELVPESVWSQRYAQINSFEQVLSGAHTHILKFFLHISPDEQAQRFDKRLRRPDKHFKWADSDLEDRKLWEPFQAAYHDMLQWTSAPEAPWFVIPADHKWYRDWAITSVLVETLREMDPQYPQVEVDATEDDVDDAL